MNNKQPKALQIIRSWHAIDNLETAEIEKLAWESCTELSRLSHANVELQNLVQRMIKDGQFFLTAVEAKEPTESDFEQWEKDAREVIARLEKQND